MPFRHDAARTVRGSPTPVRPGICAAPGQRPRYRGAVDAAFVVIRLELQRVEPLIWRIVRVPADLRLSELHRVVQTVMGWQDRHPHAFEIARHVFTPHDRTRAQDAGRQCSSEDLTIVEALAEGREGITYIYDCPAWRLRITRAPGAWRPASKSAIACLDGYLAGPGDDSGGPMAYNAILAATLGRGPRLSQSALAGLGPDFDPERFDRSAINRALAHVRDASAVRPEPPVRG